MPFFGLLHIGKGLTGMELKKGTLKGTSIASKANNKLKKPLPYIPQGQKYRFFGMKRGGGGAKVIFLFGKVIGPQHLPHLLQTCKNKKKKRFSPS